MKIEASKETIAKLKERLKEIDLIGPRILVRDLHDDSLQYVFFTK